jgi:hypothetical protein
VLRRPESTQTAPVLTNVLELAFSGDGENAGSVGSALVSSEIAKALLEHRWLLTGRSAGIRPMLTASRSPLELTLPFFDRRGLQNLHVNMGHAPVCDSQTACSGERKIKDAASYPRSPVSNTDDHGFVARCRGYTNPRAEW